MVPKLQEELTIEQNILLWEDGPTLRAKITGELQNEEHKDLANILADFGTARVVGNKAMTANAGTALCTAPS